LKTNPKLWFYLMLGIVIIFLLHNVVVYKILLEGMGVIRILGFNYGQLHFFITHLVLVLTYFVFLIIYFILARSQMDPQKTKTINKSLAIVGFIFSLLALATFIFPFVPAIFWLLGIIFSLAGLNFGFDRNKLPRLAFAGSLISGVVMLLFPYIMMMIYIIFGIGIFFSPIF